MIVLLHLEEGQPWYKATEFQEAILLPLITHFESVKLWYRKLLTSVGLLSLLSHQTHPACITVMNESCSIACSDLIPRFGARLSLPGNGADFVVWDEKQQEVQSACRVRPSTTEDVAYILDKVVSRSCNFAVKSGGHARNRDDSVSVGGITIDLVDMKPIEVSPERTFARIGTGNVLFTLYSGLEQFGLSTTGGRVADVGLGGFALGGGISNFSPKYGLAVDNILQYELVLANSTIVNVTENTHSDLYFALRGGMNNFGIVTHFTMRTFPQEQMFSGSRSFSIDQRDAVVEEASKLTNLWSNDTSMSFSYGFAYNQSARSYSLSVTEAYSEPDLEPQPFQILNSLPYRSSSLRVDWMSNFSLEGARARPPGSRNTYATISYHPAAELDRAIQDIAMEEISHIGRDIPGYSPNVIFQPLHHNAVLAGKARGGNALGIESDGPLTMVLLTIGWSNAADDQTIYDFTARFVNRAKQTTIQAGRDHRWMYINYANQIQDPFSGYGEQNRQRLIEIQRNIDPMDIFSSEGFCRGYFKLN